RDKSTLSFSSATTTTEIFTLSLHDALPISSGSCLPLRPAGLSRAAPAPCSRRRCSCVRSRPPHAATASRCRTTWRPACARPRPRSEEHTSELQSLRHLVCRLLLEKKNITLTNDSLERTLRVATLFVSLFFAISAPLEQFFRFGERWRNYRQTAELLKTYGWLYFHL